MMEHAAGETLHRSGARGHLVGADCAAGGVADCGVGGEPNPARLQRVVTFARRIAQGDLSARLEHERGDELAAMEAALNQTAERLGQSFAEIESSRHELATMLDSMQEAVVAVTAEGHGPLVEFRHEAHCWNGDPRRPAAGAFGA